MHIKRIEIHGFKSFVDRSTLELEPGVTGIVGPNGCGKSNIVDAIRWAMGEQSAKNLRGQGMEDVIFGGSESRKPLGMAEVSLIFSNEEGRGPAAFREYAEIMVTRRLYRDGESDYLINKTPCRLLDITELFMDTGVGARAYSIIEQGKIGMILSAKPEDRRFLIEEAAGVTKFKSRKKTALRKIEATRQNLLRIGDIVSEVRRQLGGLKRQAQKAERFREYREELKGIELNIARRRYAELAAESALLQRQESEQTLLGEGLSAELARHEAEMETARLEQSAAEQEVARGQERLYHFAAEIQKVEDRHALAGRELMTQQEQIGRLQQELAETGQRLDENVREEEGLQGGEISLAEERAVAEKRLQEGQGALESLAAAVEEASGRLDAARNRIYVLLSDLSRLGSQHDDAERRLRALAERVQRNRQEAVQVREQLQTAEEQSAALGTNLSAARQERQELAAEKETTAELLRTLKRRSEENDQQHQAARDELSRLQSRLDSLQRLEKNLEGYGSGVKTLLRAESLAGRFGGMLADLISAAGETEIALEAILGERLQALIAAEPELARHALELLRDRGGRSTLLVPVSPPTAVPVFAEGEPLINLVTVQPAAQAVLAHLLAGVYLVESLDSWLERPLPAGITLVSRRGESLSWRGELNGGANAALSDGLLHKKREIRELGEAAAAQQQSVARLQEERDELRRQLREAETALADLGSALHQQEIRVVNLEKDHTRQLLDAGRLGERLEVLSLEEDQLHEEEQALEKQRRESGEGRIAREREKNELDALARVLQDEVAQRRSDLDTVRESLTAVRVEAASLKEREEGERRHRERLLRQRQELGGRQTQIKGRIGESESASLRLQQEQEKLRVELEVLVRRRDEEQVRFDKLREGYEGRTARIGGREESLKALRQRLQAGRDELARVQLRLRELELEAAHLCAGLHERFRIDLAAEPPVAADEEFDAGQAAARQTFLRRAIDEIGEVNLMAIDEYRELDERYQFLTRQQEDLKLSLEGLQTAIAKINRTTRKRFRETFDQVNEKFQEIFPRLFRGGRAELRLTDEEDLLETGIDIIVQPPGKKLQNVSLLSGGEKALTATALIFSIFLIKPSPFCLLDEVDAPLDEANIGRFNEMVREMSAISQFVIITHNKRTMEIADTLYGVTMEEPGVSKLVSVRLNA